MVRGWETQSQISLRLVKNPRQVLRILGKRRMEVYGRVARWRWRILLGRHSSANGAHLLGVMGYDGGIQYDQGTGSRIMYQRLAK